MSHAGSVEAQMSHAGAEGGRHAEQIVAGGDGGRQIEPHVVADDSHVASDADAPAGRQSNAESIGRSPTPRRRLALAWSH